jgi:hypothetical protein
LSFLSTMSRTAAKPPKPGPKPPHATRPKSTRVPEDPNPKPASSTTRVPSPILRTRPKNLFTMSNISRPGPQRARTSGTDITPQGTRLSRLTPAPNSLTTRGPPLEDPPPGLTGRAPPGSAPSTAAHEWCP